MIVLVIKKKLITGIQDFMGAKQKRDLPSRMDGLITALGKRANTKHDPPEADGLEVRKCLPLNILYGII